MAKLVLSKAMDIVLSVSLFVKVNGACAWTAFTVFEITNGVKLVGALIVNAFCLPFKVFNVVWSKPNVTVFAVLSLVRVSGASAFTALIVVEFSKGVKVASGALAVKAFCLPFNVFNVVWSKPNVTVFALGPVAPPSVRVSGELAFTALMVVELNKGVKLASGALAVKAFCLPFKVFNVVASNPSVTVFALGPVAPPSVRVSGELVFTALWLSSKVA